jgi:hypothetical protein
MNRGEDEGMRTPADEPWTAEHQIRFLRQLSAQEHRCVSCRGGIEGIADFTSDRSRREFVLSGLCQRCQDSVFRRDTEPD